MLYFLTAAAYNGGEVIAMTLGENLQRLRRAKGLSQDEVARSLYLSRQSVSKWENDQAEPGVENLKVLARLYGVTVDDLVGAEESPKEEKPPVPSDSAYLRLLKLRLAALAVVVLCMIVSDKFYLELQVLSGCLSPGAAAMLLGYWVRNKLTYGLLVCGEAFGVLICVAFIASVSMMMLPLALVAGGCWIWRLSQTDIQRLFYKEDEIP